MARKRYGPTIGKSIAGLVLAVIGYLLDSLVTAQKRAAEALQADIGKREQAEKEIRRLNAELEHKVEERTSQLLAAQTELDAARARYFSLYDLAPVGYCTVSAEGLILEANHTAESLLGVGRGELVMQPVICAGCGLPES